MNWVPEQPNRNGSLSLQAHYEARNLGILTAIWRRRRAIGILLALAFVGAGAVCLTLRDRYTAEAILQVDLGRPVSVPVGQAGQTAAPDTGAIVESEARVIRSRAVARRVVADLGLADELGSRGGALLDRLAFWRAHAPAGPDPAAAERAALALASGLTVTNDSRSYLITVGYTATDPARAARIANAFVDAYLSNRLEMGVANAERAGTWLDGQITASRADLEAAEKAIEGFRQRTGLVEGGTASVSLPQQALRDASVQLAAAGQARTAAETRLGRAQEIFRSGGVPSAQDLAGAPVIQRMLENVEAAKREVAAQLLTGPRHPRYLQAKAALEDAEQRLREEVDRAVDNLKSEVRTAAGEEEAVAARVAGLKAEVIEAMGAEARLRGLQANATAIRERLKTLGDAHAQALALAAMKSSTAQVVMRAQSPVAPSGPLRALYIGLAVAGAGALGVGYALLMGRRDTGFRSGGELAEDTALRCLGMVPDISTASGAGEVRMFDEAIRMVAASLGWPRAAGAPRVLLVTSSVPDEGKSLLCMALAKLLAARGTRILVIDATGARPASPASRMPALEDVVLGDQAAFLARAQDRAVTLLHGRGRATAQDFYLSPAFETFMEGARASFDLVLIEAPPAMLVLDFVPLAHVADAAILAVRWASTPRKTVLATLQRLQDLSVRVRGLVLTRVDLDQHRHEPFADACSHYHRYRSFFESAGAARAAESPAGAAAARAGLPRPGEPGSAEADPGATERAEPRSLDPKPAAPAPAP
ncbi:GumC family protein [Methylobacterium radiodurans]|uniref:Lipopolysaccharide biosynthesis protein n=1 Tax=Methylobacterium radiodurans TaxID=2202828 RepID=A0A2U8VWM5_9HYPH|nr:exopolysaccharide transport family protein [Methylobacterium radiodurans]AWN38213.1 lipopolysaccharide biosynthesis protein [Methylobacterium radiodurans]